VRRGLIDYRMQRRALLRRVASGEVPAADVRDAHRELVRAGTHIGADADRSCPLCEGEGRLRTVTYVFTGRAAKGRGEGGAAIPPGRLEATLRRLGDLKVYLVEVCLDCHWHHLVESWWELREGRAAG
jgi:hypothetical protein